MKTYIAPGIASMGGVIESTRTITMGKNDPRNVALIELLSPGSVGFLV